jgi:hypothetical protein
MSGHATHRQLCQNCGAALHGPYCSRCGQHDVDYSGSFWHILEDALEGALHFDGKFFTSARLLFRRPGFLTTEFMAGRRARYMHPVRLYVFASFLFFAATVVAGHFSGSHVVTVGPATRGVSVKAAPADAEVSWLDNPVRIRVDPGDHVDARDMNDEFWHLLPEVLILCIPLLALVLKLAYLGLRLPYLEHLIFALHVQALAFLCFVAIKGCGDLAALVSIPFENGVGLVLVLGMYYLIYCAFRRVYAQGAAKSAAKLVAVLVGYGLVLLAAMIALGTASRYLVSRG